MQEMRIHIPVDVRPVLMSLPTHVEDFENSKRIMRWFGMVSKMEKSFMEMGYHTYDCFGGSKSVWVMSTYSSYDLII